MARSRERTALIEDNQQRHRCCKRCCLQSKAAITILAWNLIIVTCLDVFLDPQLYSVKMQFELGTLETRYTGVAYSISALLFILFLLAECLADIRWSRYKTIVNSLCCIFWCSTIILLLGALVLAGSIPVIVDHFLASNSTLTTVQTISVAVICVTFGSAILFGILLIICSIVAFRANVIQFGIDQLQDSPTDDSVLFIFWYVFTSYLGIIPARILFPFMSHYNIHITYATFLWTDAPIIFAVSPLLGISLCLQ